MYYGAPARKNLLDFIEEHTKILKIPERIGQDPAAWIDELNIISHALTGDTMIGAIGLFQPPIGDPDFKELGNGAFLYCGNKYKLRGLWMKEGSLKQPECMRRWTHFDLGSRAIVGLDAQLEGIPFETFLPENFEKTAIKITKKDRASKRPIWKFPMDFGKRQTTVYAKGSWILCSYFYEYAKPSYRQTTLGDINKITAKKEMDLMTALSKQGVKTPNIIGYYESTAEDYLFLEEVRGEDPSHAMQTSRATIIQQDAKMLAALCLLGKRKAGFTDFDDKIFNGQDLYLIDVDECDDLYAAMHVDFKALLLNPTSTTELKQFRAWQKGLFQQVLKDAIYSYKDSLVPTKSDQEEYICSFFERLKWRATEKDVKRLTTFPEHYQTLESSLAMMDEE